MLGHFIRLISLVKSIKWKFYLPNKRFLLIYDVRSEIHFSRYFNKNSYEILHSRGETVYFFLMFAAVMAYVLKSDNLSLMQVYINKYIKYVNPKVILTFVDNDQMFWLLKSQFKDKVFISVQNGVRTGTIDAFNSSNRDRESSKYFIDHMFVFGKVTKNLYKKYIGGNIYCTGSFLNNLNHRPCIAKRDVIYVLPFKPRKAGSFIRLPSGENVTWNNCFHYNDKILKFLYGYCNKNNYTLSVLGKSKVEVVQIEEEKYVDSIIPRGGYEFIKSTDKYTSYEVLLNSNISVCIDSTIGYEMLARKKKVAYLSVRENSHGEYAKFGWPELPEIGPFWTNLYQVDEFKRVLDYVIHVDEGEWADICNMYVKDIIEYDDNNLTFLSLMKEVGVPITGKLR